MLTDFLKQVSSAGPVGLGLALATLPLIGVPISPFWIAAGVVLGPVHGLGLAVVGLGVNLTLAYWVSRVVLRGVISRRLEKSGYGLPDVGSDDAWKLVLAVRLIPGVPLVVQNYLLGVANVPFGTYLGVSLPPLTAYAAGFIWLGDSIVTVRGGGIVAACGLLVGLGFLLSFVRRRLVGTRTGRTNPMPCGRPGADREE